MGYTIDIGYEIQVFNTGGPVINVMGIGHIAHAHLGIYASFSISPVNGYGSQTN